MGYIRNYHERCQVAQQKEMNSPLGTETKHEEVLGQKKIIEARTSTEAFIGTATAPLRTLLHPQFTLANQKTPPQIV